MLRRARTRFRLSLLVLASLLFQQVAMAAYACELVEAAPPPMPAGMAHWAQLDLAPVHAESPALCEKHCAPDLTLLTDTAAPSVPAMVLPPSFALVLHVPAMDATQYDDVPISRSDPPPRLRYCSLLI
jgi:hypothetical protein